MNWAVVRLIAGREIRDLLRDRRSVILLVILPILLYPIFGLVFFYFAISLVEHVSRVGIVNLAALPQPTFSEGMRGSWWAVGPSDVAGSGLSVSEPVRLATNIMNPALMSGDRWAQRYFASRKDQEVLQIVPLTSEDRTPLDAKIVDVILVIPHNYGQLLASETRATFQVLTRVGDESSKLAEQRLQNVLNRYEVALRLARFARHHLPADFDAPILVHSPRDDESPTARSTEDLREQLAKCFPLLLVMWCLAGALHPAIDLCAGEKERGTMETLLLSPATRTEIVAGKLIAVGGFSLATAIWNLVWMSGMCLVTSWFFPTTFLPLSALICCAILTMPLAMLFASVAIALGAFARSTKEGQYYLLPLLLGVLPFILLSIMPNLELTWTTSLIPVTGFCLVLSRLIGPAANASALIYLIPVLISMSICVFAAGAWAVAQFHREDVLFREAEGTPVELK